MEDYRLAYFYNNGSSVRIYCSKLPDPKAENCEMMFVGPKLLSVPDKHAIESWEQSDPIFNSSTEEIYWASHGQAPDDWTDIHPRSSVIHIWRLGRQFSVDRVESLGNMKGDANTTPWTKTQIGLVPYGSWYRPSVVYDSETMTAAVTVRRLNGNDMFLAIMQKPKDATSWTEVKYRGGHNDGHDRKGPENTIFSYTGISPPEGISYIYAMAQTNPNFGRGEANFDRLYLDTMKASNFAQISKDQNLMWQKNSIELGWGDTKFVTYVFTHGSQGHNIIFARLKEGSSQLITATVPLNKDGSLDYANHKSTTNKGSMEAVKVQVNLSGESNPPYKDDSCLKVRAWAYDGNVLFLWQGNKGCAGIVGPLDENGRIPENWKWRTVNVKFEEEIGALNRDLWDIAGVIVTKSFCE